ncbi:hypothetical protein AKO1_007624 [Acrasis kona]|uniref:MHD2 domain-containing protein n=1 Tax=Acrasis kona TaxID=1008807 RepID=A0AAW2YQH4_9EUKA
MSNQQSSSSPHQVYIVTQPPTSQPTSVNTPTNDTNIDHNLLKRINSISTPPSSSTSSSSIKSNPSKSSLLQNTTGVSRSSSDKRCEVVLSQIQNNLNHMLRRGIFGDLNHNQNHRLVTKNIFNALIISLENLDSMRTSIIQYLNRSNPHFNHYHHDQQQLTGDEINQNIFTTRSDYLIYTQVLRIVHFIKHAELSSPRRKSNQKEQEEESITQQQQVLKRYQTFFELSDFNCYLLHVKMYTENFDHTISNLVELEKILIDFDRFVEREKTRFDQDEEFHFVNTSTRLNHEFQIRIMDLKVYFGVDTYVTSTHDFENDDGNASLMQLLNCVKCWIRIENKVLGADTLVNCLFHKWLQLYVNKLYSCDELYSRSESNPKSYLVQFASRLIFQCDRVVRDCDELCNRFSCCFLFPDYELDFSDIICIEHAMHLSADIDRFCKECVRHQSDRLSQNRMDFDTSIAMFHKLCPKIKSTFRWLKRRCDKVHAYPLGEILCDVIGKCITIPFMNRLNDYYNKAITFNKVQTAQENVLFTSSCVDVTNALLKPLGMIIELDFSLVNQKHPQLILYLQNIRSVLQQYLTLLRHDVEKELNQKQQVRPVNGYHWRDKNKSNAFNVAERIERASIQFNNVNGVFLQFKLILTSFNNNYFNSDLNDGDVVEEEDTNQLEDVQQEKQQDEDLYQDDSVVVVNDDQDEYDYDMLSIYQQYGTNGVIADVFDLKCVKDLLDDIRKATHSIASFFSQWIFTLNEARLRAVFRQEDPQALNVLLQSMDRFFTVLSEHLYIELLHEVLKHLFVLLIQHLLKILLSHNTSNSLNIGVNNSHILDYDATFRTPVEKSFHGFRELFLADGEGLSQNFLDQYSRELQAILNIYNHDTQSLIQLYKTLTNDDSFVLLSIVETNGADISDSVSVHSDSSSTDSSVMLQNMHQQVMMTTIANVNLDNTSTASNPSVQKQEVEFLNPELILLLLGMRRKDKEARIFVKKQIKKK